LTRYVKGLADAVHLAVDGTMDAGFDGPKVLRDGEACKASPYAPEVFKM
jgi:hypothetical protein